MMMVKRWLALGALLCLGVASVVWGQGVPESKREMGEDYRWYWDTTAVADGETVRVRFPDSDATSNDIPLATGNIATTTTGKTTVWWVQMAQYEGNVDLEWIVFSPCIPGTASGQDANSVVVRTNENVPFFTFGGCTIDSVWTIGITNGGLRSVYATDGK
jgi:hypothetical protein